MELSGTPYSIFDVALKQSLWFAVLNVLGKKKLYLKEMIKRRIHEAFQLEVCEQCNQKLSKGWLKVPQIDFVYILFA